MNRITSYLFAKPQQPREVKWFTNTLYLFLLYKVSIYCFQFTQLFSDNAFIYNRPYISHSLKDIAFVLTNYYSPQFAFFLLLFIALACVLGLINKSNYILKILLWLAIINLHHYLYPIITAGEFLLNQLLLFNVFFTTNSSNNATVNDVKNVLHNASLIGIKIQVCLAYSVSVLYKLQCAEWLNGTAIYQTLQIPVFSNSFLLLLPSALFMAATYLVIVYQLVFPVLVFNTRFKIYVLALGILQHLFIALAMGLTSFGFIMIICYILFLKYDYK